MNNFKNKGKRKKYEKGKRIDIEIVNFLELSKNPDEKRKVIVYVERSLSYAKEYAFKTYINKRYNYRGDKYVIARCQFEKILPENMNPASVINTLKEDLNNVYKFLKDKNPNLNLEKSYAFNYSLDYSDNSKKGELMTIAVMRVSDEYARVQYSPIIPITKNQYDMLIGKDSSKEGKLLYDLITEKRFGIEQYGLAGYLTNGKIKTHNMYMEALLDIIPEYKDEEKFRPKILEYKNYRTSKNAYMYSIKTEEEKLEYNANENEIIV